MIYRLPAEGSSIDHNSVPAFHKAFLFRYRGGFEKQVAHQSVIRRPGSAQGCNLLFRNQENVSGRLGIDVSKSQTELILKDNFGGNFLVDNLLEDTHFPIVQSSPMKSKESI